jgi:outer membrane receptor protein involved in Fe transport
MYICIGIVDPASGSAAAPDSDEQTADSSNVESSTQETVTVTARKREERITNVPGSITTFSEQSLRDYDILSFTDFASKTPNLSFAYGNGSTAGDAATAFGNARTIAIRGVAGARTTGFYIDDTPLPGAVDPRIIDLSSIEVLKGPQGTLFGESSLGGNIRLVSKAPHLKLNSFRYMLGAGHTEGGGQPLNSTAEAIGNVVLSEDKAAVRLVAFSDDNAGYLTRSYLSDINNPESARIKVDNQGAQRESAASLTALTRLTDSFDMSFRVLHQNTHFNGFPATYAPLPSFKPIDTIEHTADIQPLVDDSFTLPSLTFTLRGADWNLVSTTSYFSRDTRDVEDSTEGTAQYWESTIPQGFAWTARHTYRQWTHETRLAWDPRDDLSAIVGVYYARNRRTFSIDRIDGWLGEAPGTQTLLWEQMSKTIQRDRAVFGELYYTFAEKFTLTLGNRYYWLDQSNDLTFAIRNTQFTSNNDNKESGSSPKIALAYQPTEQSQIYATAAQGFRAGGAQLNVAGFDCDESLEEIGQTPESITKINSDSVTSYEAGGKIDFPHPGLLLTASLFRITWDDIQQPLFLASCGFYLQGNAGAARIDGSEMELLGSLTRAWKIRSALGYQETKITEQGITGQPSGSRIYHTPKWTATIGSVYSTAINERLKGFVAADYSYTGDSISSNAEPGINLVRESYDLINARIGTSWGNSELSLNGRNLGNSRPNLGDIGYIGYARYDTSGGAKTPIPQVATLPPRSFMIKFAQNF